MVEVIGAGLGRTGCYSLRVALERLGYDPCHHMSSLGEDRALLAGWESVAEGGEVRWDELMASYRAAVDWPACAFWRPLITVFPQAKVVLTIRDPARWYASAHRTIHRHMGPQRGLRALVMGLENMLNPSLARRREICRRLVWEGTFGGRFDDRDHAIEVFTRHNRAVRRAIAPERLRTYDVAQGWEPLCGFLGVPVPAEPFPRLNDPAHWAARNGLPMAES